MIEIRRYHLILDLECRTFPSGKDKQYQLLESFLHKLVEKIDMTIIAGPDFAYGDGKKKGSQIGWSAVCIIDFSSITIHHFAKSKELKLDVFSCKPFDHHTVTALVLKTFDCSIRNELLLTI